VIVMKSAAAITIGIVLACAPAYAQHEHGGHEHHHEEAAQPFSASVALVAASFDTMEYIGNYQGAIPSFGWSHDRFSVMAMGSAYRIEKNGATSYGAGDAMLHGQAVLVRGQTADAGISFAASLPTGSEPHQLGMGHLMLMPAVFASWSVARVRAAASLGYSRALGGGSHMGHGARPLVSPMMPSEMSWSVGAEVLLGKRIAAGARGGGGIPVGEGDLRAFAATRVAWHASSMETALELQAGLAGDPFTVRGVVSTALSF
jgi:hypothetical protein